MRKTICKLLRKLGIIFALSFVVSTSLLLYGSTSKKNISETMALAFKSYYKKTGQDFIAAEMRSDDPRDPMRRTEFTNAALYQNFWQLKKGPDNSLIRVITPAYLESQKSIVAPLTLYPLSSETDPFNDEGAITPVVYSGYDSDFRGDYLDIEIARLSDKTKQIEWGDFYSGGDLENYRKDTHSIMISEYTAKKIYSNRNNIPIQDVTFSDIETLVGTFIRSTVISESGTTRAQERETALPADEQDSEIINNVFFDSKYCNLKRIVGILDNKSAEKYYPLIGNDFVFVFPTNYISYDYFHPTIYAMFKQNFIGNRTSLRYLLPLSEFADNNNDYHFNFCDIDQNKLVRDGYLQQNFEHCKRFYNGDKGYTVSTISFVIAIFAELSLLLYLVFNLIKAKRQNKNMIPLVILGLLFMLLLPVLIWTIFTHFPFFSFEIPTYSIAGFIWITIFDLTTLITCSLLGLKKRHKKGIRLNRNAVIYSKTQISLLNGLCGLVLGFVLFILVNVISLKTSIVSVGIPLLVTLFGCEVGMCLLKSKTVQSVKDLKKDIKFNLWFAICLLFGVALSIVISLFGYIWVPGIGISALRIVVSLILGIASLIGSYFVVFIIHKIYTLYIETTIENSGTEFYEKIEI